MAILVRRVLVTASLSVLVGLAALGVVRSVGPATAHAVPGLPAGAVQSPPVGAEPVAAGPTELAAEFDALLAADTTTARPDRATIRGALRRLAAWDRLVHATAVVDLKNGGLTTIQLDHGTISAVSATSLTIAEAGGGSVTVALDGETRVRRGGAKAAAGDLKTTDEVFVMSKVEAGGADAYLVVVARR